MTAHPDLYLAKDSCPVSLVVRAQGTTSVIEFTGEWDLAGEGAVRDAVEQAWAHDPECLVLDFSGLTFIDSSGLHATVEIVKRASASDVRLVIIPGPREVQRPFEICELAEQLPFAEPLSAAGSALATRG